MPFDPRTASWIAQYANDAYLVSSDTKAGEKIRFESIDGSWDEAYDYDEWLASKNYKMINNPNGATPLSRNFGIIALTTDIGGQDAVVVALRGTVLSWHDLAIDALGGMIYPSGGGRIHFPFAEWRLGSDLRMVWVHKEIHATYENIRESIYTQLKPMFQRRPNAKLYITGHSLGGALAAMCAADLGTTPSAKLAIPPPRLWTFGSPFTGDQRFATVVNEVTQENYRIADRRDWVPTVPHDGWTPAWLKWFLNNVPPTEPSPKTVPYIHVGTKVETDAGFFTPFPLAHSLGNYYASCKRLASFRRSSTLGLDTAIHGLEVRIRTRTHLDAGTDDDVYVELLGVVWGPLNGYGNGFCGGSDTTYNLFTLFPDKVPANPSVANLTSIALRTTDGAFTTVSEQGWQPDTVEIRVNGGLFGQVDATGFVLSWSTGRQLRVPLTQTV